MPPKQSNLTQDYFSIEWIRKKYINTRFILQMSKWSVFLYLKDTSKKWLTLHKLTFYRQWQKTSSQLFYSWYMPPLLSVPIHCPYFNSVNFSLWGLPHQLSVLTNFHPIPSVSTGLEREGTQTEYRVQRVSTKLRVGSPDVGSQNPSGVRTSPEGMDAATTSHSITMSPNRVCSDLGF